jgi:hypothetical protein
MAELAEKDFAIFLPDVVQNIIESFESQSGFFANKSLVGTLLQDKFSGVFRDIIMPHI